MKLGKETGSVINHISSRHSVLNPEIGMGVTFLSWTDRHPGTIVEIFKKGAYEYIVCQADNYERTDDNGMSEMQSYKYTPNPDAHKVYYRRRNPQECYFGCSLNENGRFIKNSNRLAVGYRERYYDFSF